VADWWAKVKWPKECPVFRDGPELECDILVGVGVVARKRRIDVVRIASRTFPGKWTRHDNEPVYFFADLPRGDLNTAGLRWLKPLTPAAREMLAAARGDK
jgi:hypothetical protein